MKTLTEKIESLLSAEYSASDLTQAFAVPGEGSIIDMIHPATGRGTYSNENLDEIRRRYPGAVIVFLDEWCAEKARQQDAPVTWSEVTEERYYDALDALPPACMVRNGFLLGEPWDHHATSGQPRYSAYRRADGEFLTSSRPMTVAEFREFMEQIEEQAKVDRLFAAGGVSAYSAVRGPIGT